MISITIHSPNVELGGDWDDLLSRANPNVFMSPTALRAADVTMFAHIHVLLAWHDDAQSRRLVGFWALQQRRTWPLMSPVLDALPFEYAFLSSPITDPAFVADVMPAFFRAIAATPTMPRVIVMKSLEAEAASYRPMVDAIALRDGRFRAFKTENRPVMWRDGYAPTTGERRKKLRQAWKRLSALGEPSFVSYTEPDAVMAAVETFLQLELKGWKGTAGTALLCADADATFARRLIANLAEQRQVIVQALLVGEDTIATQIVMLSGKMAFTWKTTFDHSYARFSPGALLIDRATEQLFATTEIVGIDSCAAETSFVSQIWRPRRAMADVLVGIGPGASIGYRMELAWHVGREHLKRIRDRLVSMRAARRKAHARSASDESSTGRSAGQDPVERPAVALSCPAMQSPPLAPATDIGVHHVRPAL